ncbi:hypothetical protein H310_02986 [Aphanomyces invadans]|uniref:Uncharacterized protein n=1 Tax=Aphanomyces invadans TaxID=157072 RepID=A0A024ULY0_9STRA|nr:hypothetical protein H310_02986 [Aphanomyces invadans]ETW06852.1 hypothetical protein H310_02986 [Aphanomyces invadans]|eukprot:XP_008864927.1 hypothetical protein H310_02986 [Aphanomyces invadans]
MASNLSDTPAWTIDTPTESLWAAEDELRQRRQTLISDHRNDRRNFKQRFDTYRKLMATNPHMRSNAEMQLQMMNQQKDVAKENFEREMDKVVSQIETIERLVDRQMLLGTAVAQTNVRSLPHNLPRVSSIRVIPAVYGNCSTKGIH